MAGYSGTPLATKLGIKPGTRVALVGAPADFPITLEPLPEDARVLRALRAPVDVALLSVHAARISNVALGVALPRSRRRVVCGWHGRSAVRASLRI